MLRIHWLQHVPFEGLGVTADWAAVNGAELSCTRMYAGDAFPETDEFDWLVVMGGPMSVYEEEQISWLAGEKRFIEGAVRAGKKVIGVCLGSQFIADVLGAKVYAGPQKEIGWHPVVKEPSGEDVMECAHIPEKPLVFQWHGDTFDLPSSAVRIFSGEACANQAFAAESGVYAFQFHLELRAKDLAPLIEACRHELQCGGAYVQSEERLLADTGLFEETSAWWQTFLDRVAESTAVGARVR